MKLTRFSRADREIIKANPDKSLQELAALGLSEKGFATYQEYIDAGDITEEEAKDEKVLLVPESNIISVEKQEENPKPAKSDKVSKVGVDTVNVLNIATNETIPMNRHHAQYLSKRKYKILD